MHQHLKERLVGAAVLVIIAVIFIPMLLTGPIDNDSIANSNIPDRPTEKFNAKLIPLTELTKPALPDELDVPAKEEQTSAEITQNSDSTGSAEVILETKIPNKTQQKNTAKDKQVGLTAWVVQLGSFSSKVNADKLNLTLRKSGFPAFVEPLKQEDEIVYRVRVGPELLRSDADALLKKIKENTNLDGIVLNYP